MYFISLIWEVQLIVMHLNNGKNVGKSQIVIIVDNTAICDWDNLNQKYCII